MNEYEKRALQTISCMFNFDFVFLIFAHSLDLIRTQSLEVALASCEQHLLKLPESGPLNVSVYFLT